MADGESNMTENLSKKLTLSEDDMKQTTCREKDLDSECKNNGQIDAENANLKEEEREEKSKNIECNEAEEENKSDQTTKEIESDFKDCLNTEFLNNVDKDNSERENRSSRISGNKSNIAVDEALLEEDEDGISNDEENYESAEEEHLTIEEAEERKNEAMELKTKGNEHFRNKEYVEGKDCYSRAIKRCPKDFPENKSIFYANRAACSQKMEDYESAINDCSKALELHASYLKARVRRAQCYEKADKLEEALEDYKIVYENDRSCQSAREAIIRLPEEIKVKHEKLKEEMIGKLKDLGNMVLRPFGLSTENFKLQQDPNSGGYSINFQK